MITSQKIQISFTGSTFSPSVFERETGITFTKKYEVGDFMYNKVLATEGRGRINAPTGQSLDEFLTSILFLTTHAAFQSVEKVTLNIIYEYKDQCNLHFTQEEMLLITKFRAEVYIRCEQDKVLEQAEIAPFNRFAYGEELLKVGLLMKKARIASGMKIKQVAEMGIVSFGLLSKIERGQQPFDVILFQTLCNLYHITPDSILK